MADHDLSQGVEEYFTFSVQGYKYKFRHLTAEEVEKMQELKDNGDDKASAEYMRSFISKAEDNSPDFEEMMKKMKMPEIINFNTMIMEEFGVQKILDIKNASNQS